MSSTFVLRECSAMVYVAMNAGTMRHSIISQKRVGERMSRRVVNSGRFTCSTARVADMSTVPIKSKKEKKEKEDEIDENGQTLSTQQVEMLLNVLCEETEIAEIELKLDGFKMKVRRSLNGLASTGPAEVAAPAAAPMAAQTAAPAPAVMQSYDSDSDGEADDYGSQIAVKAPKVGVMRRGRYLKGKQIGKAPVVEEGATVKKGQPLCYIEQLGTFWPVESPQAGEVGAFLVDEGEAVEYLEEIVDIAPFFGGHIIGDSKYA